MKKPQGRPKKEAAQQKARYLQVRVTEAEKATFDRAADLAGVDLSAWVRERLRIVARDELGKHGEKPEFLTGKSPKG